MRAKYSCNHSFFSRIESKESAYWLGFIAADGNIYKNVLTVALKASDRPHLETLRAALVADHPVHWQRTNIDHPSCALKIYSQQIAMDLQRHGVTERKSLTLQWPTTVPSLLLRHYLRGYFDGDGCISVRPRKGFPTPQFTLQIAGTLSFLTKCRAFLIGILGVNDVKPYQPNRNAPCGFMRWGGRKQVMRICQFLYEDASVWLPRKRDIVDLYWSIIVKNSAKLSDNQVLEMRDKAAAGHGVCALAREYGLSQSATSEVVSRKTYRHL